MTSLSPWALRPKLNDCLVEPLSGTLSRQPVSGVPLGRRTAYGDCCLPPTSKRVALSTESWDHFLRADWETGRVVCRPGLPLRDLIQVALRHGWFLGASPGTARSTVGGCVACDVHGKNHHRHGSFCHWVDEIELLTGRGEILTCGPDQLPDLFWATAGGLGQTGPILRVALRLIRVQTPYIRTLTFVTQDFDETLQAIESHPEATYSVSWIDSLARGRHFGRGVVMLGEHATREELPNHLRNRIPAAQSVPESHLSLPIHPPDWASPSWVWRLFNQAYWQAARTKNPHGFARLGNYFYPLDGVGHWNRVYGRRGFLEYQVAVPAKGGAELCREILDTLSSRGYGSFLAVIKKFGPANPGLLSFPFPGFTLAVDMGYEGTAQERILRHLDEKVAAAGGRVYLVKDSRLAPDLVPAMYPRLAAWRTIVNTHDPERRWTSHLVQRLKLRDE